MTQLEGCIKYWDGILFHHKYLLEPSTMVLIESTSKFLKELRKIKEEQGKQVEGD